MPRRSFIKRSVGGLAGLASLGLPATMLAPRASAATVDRAGRQTTWGFNTNLDGWPMYAASPAEAIARVGPLVEAAGLRFVREGLTGPLSDDPLQGSGWLAPWIDWLDEHGMQLILQIHLSSVPNPDKAFGPAWEKGITEHCLKVARYIDSDPRRRRTVAWFLLINEPDLPSAAVNGMTPEHLVRMHELAWKAIKSVNPEFLIEGYCLGDGAGIGASDELRAINRGAGPGTQYRVTGMRSADLCALGATQWCDFFGFHNYNKIDDGNPFGARMLLANIADAHRARGYPVRPVVNTETGCHLHLLNAGGAQHGGVKPLDATEEQQWTAIAHWQHLNSVYQARWGVSRACYYSLGASLASWMNLVDYPMNRKDRRGNPPANVPPYTPRPSYASAVAALRPQPLATLNGSFEIPEDKYSNWIVCYDPNDFHSADLEYGEWKQAHFKRDGVNIAPQSKGRGYLQLDAGLPKQVRRRVDGLVAGRTYQVDAWVRQESAARATLAVYGFDQNRPAEATAAVTEKSGEWVRLRTSFTPQRSLAGVDSWGVVSLEHDGKAASCWDEVSIAGMT